MTQNAFGGRAAHCVENAVVSSRRHGNEISIDLCSGLKDRFDHVSLPNLCVRRNYGRQGALDGWCERPYVKKMDGQIAISKRLHQITDGAE